MVSEAGRFHILLATALGPCLSRWWLQCGWVPFYTVEKQSDNQGLRGLGCSENWRHSSVTKLVVLMETGQLL